jgi:hypothetical protein
MILFAHKIKLIDISEYSDENVDSELEKMEKRVTLKKHKGSSKHKNNKTDHQEIEE